MPPSPSKTLSPAELAKLEHAFATDPGSEAYKPLAEAYLGMGRFMEAMVVCKKGVKAHPNLPDGRVLLARVYAEQGKDKKALEELAGALQVAPTDKLVLRMAGSLQLKNGEAEAGKQNLLKAWQADPNDADTKAALAQFKIEPPKAEEPEPATERVNIPGPSAGTQRVSGRAAAPIAGPGTRASGARPALEEPIRSKPNGTQARSQAPRAPSAARKSSVRMPSYDEEEISDPSYRARQASKGKGAFIFLLVVVVLGAGAYFGIGRYRAIQTRNVNKALTDAGNQLKHDSFDSYKKACEAGERALDADSSSARAHAYLAYAWAIRWGEHGGGDEAKQQAEQHLAAAKKGDISDFPYLAAADALVKTYSGKSQEALQELDDLSKHSDSALIFLTLGIIQMNVGDLEHARDNLTKAQQMASSDPRVYAALGTLNRRRGEDEAASRNYDFALRYEKDHAESVLGYSLLVLEQDNPRFEIASRVLKRLLDSDPPPSPRQLATAHLARAYLVSRVSNEIQQLAKAEDQKELSEKTGVPMDKAKAAQDVTKEEETGFSLDRQNPELHLIKGRRLMSEKQLEGAITEFNAAIKMDPTRANYYVELARAYLAKDDPKSAAAALGDAIKRMGESPKLIDLLSTIDRKLGKLDEAIAQLKRSLADPKVKNPEGNYLLGSIYLEQAQKEPKKYADAIESLLKSQSEYFGQGWRLAQTDTELGRAYAGSGDRTKADDAFQKAIKADENFEPAYFFYGQFLVGDSKSREAGRKALQEYLRRDPKGSYAGEAQKLLQ